MLHLNNFFRMVSRDVLNFAASSLINYYLTQYYIKNRCIIKFIIYKIYYFYKHTTSVL